MDPFILTTLTTLAHQVVGILTPLLPFFGKASEAIATKVGEDVYEEGKHLYEVIQDRFTEEADNGKASKVLQNFTEDPEEYSPNLENKLLVLLQAYPDFAKTLNHILQTGPFQDMNFADNASVEDTHMNNELGKGTQRMTGGKGSKFTKVTMNIGQKKEPGG